MSAKSTTVGTCRHNSYSSSSSIHSVKTQPINTEGTRRPLTREASDQSLTSSSGDLSAGTTPNSVSLLSTSYPPSKSGEALLHNHLKRGSSQEIPLHSHSNHTALMSRTDTETMQATTSAYSDLPELVHARPLILQHPSHPAGASEESSMSWLLDFYPSVFSANSPKDKLAEAFTAEQQQQQQPPQQQQQQQDNQSGHHSGGSPTSDHGSLGGCGSAGTETVTAQPDYNAHTIFRSQEKYMVTLGAPISIAQRMGEDTLTYLNRGQFYNVMCTANLNMSMPERVKTVVHLTFFDEPDKRMEANHWQYWYNLQANPNQKAFDIDRKNCENIHGKPVDLAYNAASFVWCPEMGAKVVLRINCLSTEFSSQKGVKGIPLHFVTDTYEDIDTESAEPVHRAYCKVKIFRDKGAERKNKDETKTVERRMQKLMKQQPGVPLEAEVPASVFHPPNKETILTSTSTFGPKPFLFIPQQESVASPFSPRVTTSSFLASVKERETKRTFSNILKQAKENLDALEVESDQDNGAPPKKSARIPNQRMTTIYVRKDEEKVYHALHLDSLTVHDFKLQVADKYDIHADMIHGVYRKTKKKGLLVHFDDAMISQFQTEDDFIISLVFDNQKGHFDMYLHY